ncbi:MAG: hypothetical protein ACRYG8_06535 [Janthinobacterium lividum]
MSLTLLDDLALLRHALDDAIDGFLLAIFKRFNLGGVAQVGHQRSLRVQSSGSMVTH